MPHPVWGTANISTDGAGSFSFSVQLPDGLPYLLVGSIQPAAQGVDPPPEGDTPLQVIPVPHDVVPNAVSVAFYLVALVDEEPPA